MPEDVRLDLQKSYTAILDAARKRQFLSYGDLAAANDMPWSQARRRMPLHLGQLVTIAHERGWPLPSAIVVNRENVATGLLEGSGLEGFLAAARVVVPDIHDPRPSSVTSRKRSSSGLRPHPKSWIFRGRQHPWISPKGSDLGSSSISDPS